MCGGQNLNRFSALTLIRAVRAVRAVRLWPDEFAAVVKLMGLGL